MALASDDAILVSEDSQDSLLALPCWSKYESSDKTAPEQLTKQLQRASPLT